jgi:anti-sigma-K factor RskA
MTTDDERIAYLTGEGSAPAEEAERADLDDLSRLLSDPTLWAEPGPGVEASILAAIADDVRSVPPRTVDVPRARRRRWPAFAAAAVAVAAAVALVAVVRAPEDPSPAPLAASLSATALVPEASAEAQLTKTEAGWRVDLEAAGLPRLDDGRFYEAWLKDGDGRLVPIGTFNEGGSLVLWAGVSPVEFPTITVTKETADGDPGSSGEVVLAGPIAAP